MSATREPPLFRCHRHRMWEYLRQGVNIEFNHELESIEKDPQGCVTANFSSGESVQGGLIVGADGVSSSGVKVACIPSGDCTINAQAAWLWVLNHCCHTAGRDNPGSRT